MMAPFSTIYMPDELASNSKHPYRYVDAHSCRGVAYNLGPASNYILVILQEFSNGDASCYCRAICGYASCYFYLLYFAH